MRVFYHGRRSTLKKPSIEGTDDALELLWDNWDDHTYKTSFATLCRINGELVELGPIRILIENKTTTSDHLDKLRTLGWSGEFPPPGINFISVPSEISFYQQLKSQLNSKVAINVAKSLKDASYLVHSLEDESAIELTKTLGFKNSLQRERGSISAFVDGWKILENQKIAVQNFKFSFQNVFREPSTLVLNFSSNSILPNDINVLIGPNGVGKSRVLHQIVAAWNRLSNAESSFEEEPNLSQIVVLSYSPFEHFPVDMERLKVQDKKAYRYFGLRGRGPARTEGAIGRTRLSLDFPKADAVQSIISCIADDQKFQAISHWAKKVATVESVLRTAFEFDFAAVQIPPDKQPRYLYSNIEDINQPASIDIEDKRFIPISIHTSKYLKADSLMQASLPKEGVTFFKDNIPIELSSGQRLFAYIVINLLGIIRRNSLVLIDEPELFLHPTLEIQFIEMLKEILASFNSKALLATHSEVTVREVPAECVHVFQRTEDGLVISQPPFQTFGGDIQRISSYVFGDNYVSKPFETWLKEKLEEYGSANALLAAVGNNLSEEMIIQIKSMGDDI